MIFHKHLLGPIPFPRYLCAIFFLAVIVVGNSATVFAETTRENISSAFPANITGRYTVDYRGAWNSEEDDQQLFQHLNFTIADIVLEKISLHFSGRLSAELDGNEDSNDFFLDINDTFDHSLNGRIYYLYLQVPDAFFENSNLRLGRMYSYESESILFDGAKYEQTVDNLRFYFHGGMRATNYTSPEDDDTIGGLGLDYSVLPRTHIGYDYLRVVDDELDDDHHSFNISQRFGSLKGYAEVALLNGDIDDLNLYGSYYQAEHDLNITARYYSLLSERKRHTNEFSALMDLEGLDTSSALGVYSQFQLVNITAFKGFKDRAGISAGFETRWIDEREDRNYLNREYDKYFVSLDLWNFLLPELTASLTFEYWDMDAMEGSSSFGIDADKNISERLNLGAGFYYSKYRIRSRFVGATFGEDVETPVFYSRIKYQLRENIRLSARYQIEDESDLDTTHEIHLICSVAF